jgi:hypothetical protein
MKPEWRKLKLDHYRELIARFVLWARSEQYRGITAEAALDSI